jgi:hypothetical protein
LSRNNYRKQTNKAIGARKEKKNDKAVLPLTTKEGQDFQLSKNVRRAKYFVYNHFEGGRHYHKYRNSGGTGSGKQRQVAG